MYPALTHPALTHRDASQSQEARRLFWEWLETEHYTKDGHATHGWDRNDPTTWTDESMGEGQELGRGGDGVMGAGTAVPTRLVFVWGLNELPHSCALRRLLVRAHAARHHRRLRRGLRHR